MSILYITSFNKSIYDLNGKNFIESFNKLMPNDIILLCIEDMEYISTKNNLVYNLANDEYLNNWLENNKDIIPIELGGLAKKDTIKSIFNFRASLWFRKIISIKFAYDNFKYKFDYLIWLDADCVIKKTITSDFIENVFNGAGMIYLLGTCRKRNFGYETGFLGFSKVGFSLIEEIIKLYESDFRNYLRWDDGFIIRKMNEDINKEKIKTIDLAKEINVLDVMDDKACITYPYLSHKKGIHEMTFFKFFCFK